MNQHFFVQVACPLKIKGVYFPNVPFYLTFLYDVIKSFLPKKLKERVSSINLFLNQKYHLTFLAYKYLLCSVHRFPLRVQVKSILRCMRLWTRKYYLNTWEVRWSTVRHSNLSSFNDVSNYSYFFTCTMFAVRLKKSNLTAEQFAKTKKYFIELTLSVTKISSCIYTCIIILPEKVLVKCSVYLLELFLKNVNHVVQL